MSTNPYWGWTRSDLDDEDGRPVYEVGTTYTESDDGPCEVPPRAFPIGFHLPKPTEEQRLHEALYDPTYAAYRKAYGIPDHIDEILKESGLERNDR